jgi:type IV pilus assembly protein PilC
LAEVVREYSRYQEKFIDLKQKIIQAARYPDFVISISFGVIFFMLYYLIPSIETLFFSVNANMPTITKILLAASNFIVMNISFLFMILIITLILIYFLLKTAFVKNKIIDQVLIKSPIISKFYLHNLLARFSLSMGILLKSKVPLEHSLRISRNISDNSIFINEINKIIYSLTKGETISKNLIKSEIFDLTFRKLIATGEESAELDKVFYLISEFYSKEFDNKINSITTLLEPLLILIVGLIVLIVLVAMYLPMFEIINYIGV